MVGRVWTYIISGGIVGFFADGIMIGAAAGAIMYIAVRYGDLNKDKDDAEDDYKVEDLPS